MLERKAYAKMTAWKNSPSHRALLVTGARQIGKTFLVRKFAESYYQNIIELNFALDKDAASIFQVPKPASEILSRISLHSGKRILPGQTLVFLDEIQLAPEAMTSIKALVDEGGCDYILSGSLLGVELRNIRSNPVGYVSTCKMYPLDFEEFCWSMGVDADVFAHLRECMVDEAPVDDFVHKKLLDLFHKYLVVGGMPDAVNAFVQTRDLTAVREIQESVKDWYRTDISKYCPDSVKLKAKDAFDLVPAELSNPNKRFILKNLNETARLRTYEDAFLWLAWANVALPAFNVTEPASPLLISKDRNLFKLFYSDTGLLTSAFSNKTALSLLDGNDDVNFGGTYENAVAQELTAHGYSLYYYNSKKWGELDFVIETRDGEVLPIEVKSGKSYKRHRALDNVLRIENYGLNCGYVLGHCNVERNGKVLYLPIYMVGLLDNNR